MNPVDFSELKKFPWNEEIYLAQQGDTGAMLKTCNSAEPIVNQFCKVFYFSDWLGKGEVRSIASLALVEFIMSYPGGVGLFEAFEEKPFVDFAVVEAENLDGDAVRLAEACTKDVAVVIGDGDGVASLQAFGGVVDGTREHPRVEAV